jgi:glutamyl-tRNA reductase
MKFIVQSLTPEEWANIVQEFELLVAKRNLANGEDINTVLNKMALRIQKKMLHPIIAAIKDIKIDLDMDASRKAYEDAYLTKNFPKADHVDDH